MHLLIFFRGIDVADTAVAAAPAAAAGVLAVLVVDGVTVVEADGDDDVLVAAAAAELVCGDDATVDGLREDMSDRLPDETACAVTATAAATVEGDAGEVTAVEAAALDGPIKEETELGAEPDTAVGAAIVTGGGTEGPGCCGGCCGCCWLCCNNAVNCCSNNDNEFGVAGATGVTATCPAAADELPAAEDSLLAAINVANACSSETGAASAAG